MLKQIWDERNLVVQDGFTIDLESSFLSIAIDVREEEERVK